MQIKKARWIHTDQKTADIVPVFEKQFCSEKPVRHASLQITAYGVYEAVLNGERVGSFVLAPGWTVYEKRLQVQTYDVTGLLQKKNVLRVKVGKGWYASPLAGWIETEEKKRRAERRTMLLACLQIEYADGSTDEIVTDDSWIWKESAVRFSEIYDGETYDARLEDMEKAAAGSCISEDLPMDNLIAQEGEEVREMERVAAMSVFTTPAGETVVDFGQEVTGYVEFTVDAKDGDRITILHGEVLDQDGNFYNANYRSAKAKIEYICRDGLQTWHPRLTFFGFRYLKLEQFPGNAGPEQFTAIVVCSDIRRTGWVTSGYGLLNQLISNIFWGQKGNYLDVPTDCPQRDERLGWTGDAQVFVKAASLNFDVERFFRKWLGDLKADQREDGGVGHVIPDVLGNDPSAAWGDAAVICPWQIYQTYGDKQVLRDQFGSMKKWVEYIGNVTQDPYLWTGGEHFGDWLGLDAPSGSYKGSTREEFIAGVFYANAVRITAEAGKVLGEDTKEYEELYEKILQAFRSRYPEYLTQTEHVLAIRFGLSEDPKKTADALAEMIRKNGCSMQTGFVGTPYLLHVLSDYGHEDLAWSLLLREQYPSWLYSVRKGATTIWEHWDGIMEEGSLWSTDMNSFNHYAYGSVIDWIYEKAAGIRHEEEEAGFTAVTIDPLPDQRIGWLDVSLQTRNGRIRSSWRYTAGMICYEIETQVPARIRIDGITTLVQPGRYTFWGPETKTER